MAKRRPKSRSKPGPNLGQLLRAEVIGSALVVLALLSLLSLLSSNRGQVTEGLVDGLRLVFGIGVWVAPFLLGALGLWLALSQVTDQEVFSARRLAGAAGLFLVFEAVAHIVTGETAPASSGLFAGPADPWALAQAGEGGGILGFAFSQMLVVALGLTATIAVLLAITAVALLALSGLTLAQVMAGLKAMWHWLRGSAPVPGGVRGTGPLLARGQEPPWKRWWRRLAGWRTPNGTPLPSLEPPSWAARGAPQQGARGASARPPTAPASAAAGAAPRIVGQTGQAWRLPVLGEVLEDSSEQDIQGEDLRRRAQIIETTLQGFGLPVSVVEANQGPAVTQFGLRPGIIVRHTQRGEEKRTRVRVSQIQALANDLSLALAASPIRIEAPVPGRDIVGVEVPNVQISLVALRGVMESEEFRESKGALKIGLGRDVSGQPAVTELTRMPHLLIAGATGSGKSVCVNALITALLLTHTPDTLRFVMIDPKRVELTVYNGIPHLIAPVVVDVERAVPVLQWATREMERRYKLFAKVSARNIEGYNEKLAARGEPILPYIVILVDELADLMLSAPEEVERYVCRIAQMARATGMHLVIATQRPSVDVVTGLIKANFPARIAFAVISQVDSRVILDTPGAEQLLGRGDMLYMAPDASKLLRLQGCFVADRETQRLVRHWKGARMLGPETGELEPLSLPGEPPSQQADQVPVAAGEAGESTAYVSTAEGAFLEPPWLPGQEALQQPLWGDVAAAQAAAGGRDDLYEQAATEVRKSGRASVSLLQRRLRIGYSRAARLIDELEKNGVIGPDMGGSRGREVLPGAPAQEGR